MLVEGCIKVLMRASLKAGTPSTVPPAFRRRHILIPFGEETAHSIGSEIARCGVKMILVNRWTQNANWTASHHGQSVTAGGWGTKSGTAGSWYDRQASVVLAKAIQTCFATPTTSERSERCWVETMRTAVPSAKSGWLSARIHYLACDNTAADETIRWMPVSSKPKFKTFAPGYLWSLKVNQFCFRFNRYKAFQLALDFFRVSAMWTM